MALAVQNNNELAEKYSLFIERVVRQVMSRFSIPPTLSSEYLGAAYSGLIEAAERFDESTGVPFEKYAYLRVRGSIIDYIRESCSESSRSAKAAKLIRASDCIAEDFQSIKPRINSDEVDQALAEALDYVAKGALIFRLNYHDYEEEIQQETDITIDQEEQFHSKKIQEALYRSIEDLPAREKQVLISYYFKDRSFQQIGNEIGVSRSWVCRVHAKSLNVLKKLLEERLAQGEWV